MVAQNKLLTIIPHPVTTIYLFDADDIIDSIFLIKSLLLAIVKEGTSDVQKNELAISRIKEEIFSLKQQDKISNIDFFHIDSQFYTVLVQQKTFERLAKIILKEKLHLDRCFRLFLKQEESYKSIIRIYGDVLEGVQSKNIALASKALCELEKNLEKYVLKAKKCYPAFFR